jgi:multidrug efflux pump subunit AcrA (membrane-fusion protein)
MDTRAPAADHDPEAQATPPSEPTLVPRAQRSSGSDRFDDAIVVTRSRAWIGLACCLALILGIVAWAVTTEVGVTVDASGIALTNGAIATVSSPASGTVQAMNVKVDQAVQAGQVIGSVADLQNKALALVAPVSGRVLNVAGDVGSTVRLGADVVSISQASGPLLVRMFVTPAEAQEADLTTEAVMHFPEQPDVRGRVTAIGTLPMTKEQAADSIGSPALANLLVHASSVINITVTPDESATQTAHIDNGDVATVTLIVGTKRPIDYVI